MTGSEVQGASRPTRRLTLTALAIWAILVFALPLAALTLNAVKLAGFPLGYWVTAQGALLALATLAIVFAMRAGGTRGTGGLMPPLAFAGEAIGAVGVVGFAGAIAALGYDGLAYPLGMAAGLALLAILIAPRFALYPVRSISGFFVARYGGVWPRRMALAIAGLASVLLLAADVRGGALAVQGLAGADYATAVATVTVALTLAWLLRSFMPGRVPFGVVYGFLLVSFLHILVVLALHQGRLPLPHLVAGYALNDLAGLDQKLVIDKLADVKSLKPMASPFLQLSMANFAGLVLALALGVAALPHLLGRHVSQTVVAAGDAPRRAALALVFAVALLLGLAAFAVMARFGVEAILASGVETAALPQQLVRASGLGWVDICGSNSGVAADIAAACAKASGHRGFLRLQDVAFTSDGFFFAAPWIAGVPAAAFMPLWAAVLVAALATGHAILAGLLSADGEARRSGAINLAPLNGRSVGLAIGLLLSALFVAMLGSIEIPALASEGLALIASGLFPALVLGLYWRRMTAMGAIAAMASGFAVAALYTAGVRLFPVAMFEWTGALSNAAPGAVRKFADLQAAVAAASSAEMRAAANAALSSHAGPIANWWGLKPAASVLFAVPAGFLAAAIATLISTRTQSGGATSQP